MSQILLIAAFVMFCMVIAAPSNPRIAPWGKAHRRLMIATAAVIIVAVSL